MKMMEEATDVLRLQASSALDVVEEQFSLEEAPVSRESARNNRYSTTSEEKTEESKVDLVTV